MAKCICMQPMLTAPMCKGLAKISFPVVVSCAVMPAPTMAAKSFIFQIKIRRDKKNFISTTRSAAAL
ncbi:hypothetical protein D3C87_1197680 [compost metagenome]